MSAASPGVQNDTTSLRIPAYLLPLKITLKYTGRPAVFMFVRGEQLAKASISNQPLFPFNIIPTPTLYRSSLLQGREENFIRFHTHTQPDISEFLHGSIFASCQFLLLSCKKKKKEIIAQTKAGKPGLLYPCLHSTNIPSLFYKTEPEQTGSPEQERGICTGSQVLSFLLGSFETNTELNLHKSNVESSMNEFLCTGLRTVLFFVFNQPGKRKDQKSSVRSVSIPRKGCAEGTQSGKRMEARMAHSHNQIT